MSTYVWKRKKEAWENKNITVVAPSAWLGKCAQQSSLFRDFPIEVIPNGIDTFVFKPIPKNIARKALNLSQDKKTGPFWCDEFT